MLNLRLLSFNWSFSFWLYYVDQEDNQSVVIGSTDERFLTVWDANHVLNYRENDDDYIKSISIIPEIIRVSPYKTAADMLLNKKMSNEMKEN